MTEPQTLDKQLLDMHFRLEDLRSRYTDDYPDVLALKDMIEKTETLKKQTETEWVSNQGRASASSALDVHAIGEAPRDSRAATMQIASQLKANQLEIQSDQLREKDLESQISAYQVRLNMTPETEQKLADVSRGYDESKSNYDSLLQKQMQSQLATSLEQQQQGEQFRILDPPSLPNKPSAPNHFRISLGGLGLGIVVGMALAALLELTDIRVYQEKDLQGIVPVRVLVGIPRLSTFQEDHSRLTKRWIQLGALAAMALMIVIGNLYSFYKG